MSYWNILVVDDLKEMLSSIKKILTTENQTVLTTDHPEIVVEILIQKRIDLIITDLMMPGMSGMNILKIVKRTSPNTPVIMISAFGTVDRAVTAMKRGAFSFIEKPFTDQRLLVEVEKALNYRQLLIEHQQLLVQNDIFKDFVGNSTKIRQIKDQIPMVAESNCSVLITGETGTGKEKVARLLHSQSQNSSSPFVAINAGAVAPSLFESELFGHEKGAFTGAHTCKNGLFEKAQGGTLFLDEIGELEPHLQVKLLRALDSKIIRRVGGTGDISIHVRIVAATNQNPEKALQEKRLREDLYYRLAVFHIHIPPLRARKDDIPLLIEHFMSNTNQPRPHKYGFTSAAMTRLEDYSWPGNIRELKNCIERCRVLAPDRPIELEDLPDYIYTENAGSNTSGLNDFNSSRQRVLSRFEQKYIIQQLDRHNGNVTRAAKGCGLSRRTFYRLLKKYSIPNSLWRSA